MAAGGERLVSSTESSLREWGKASFPGKLSTTVHFRYKGHIGPGTCVPYIRLFLMS